MRWYRHAHAPRRTSRAQRRKQDGSARTREAKLGCVFTQTHLNAQGNPLREEDGCPLRGLNSTSYVGTYQGCREIVVLLNPA